MNLTFTVFLCLLVPNNASDVSSESVAIVNLQECLKFAPTYEHDKGVLSRDIEATDREAKKLLNQLKKKEALSKRENATELDHLNARLSSLEFDAFRQREQSRLKDAEVATVLSHDRRFWTGFAIVGGGYFLVSLILSAGSRLFTTYVLAMILSNPIGSGELEGWTSYPLLTNMEDLPESFSPFVAIGQPCVAVYISGRILPNLAVAG